MGQTVQPSPEDLFHQWAGTPPERRENFARSGSSRHYVRWIAGNRSAISTQSPLIAENETFIRLSRRFRDAGIRVPDVYLHAPDFSHYLQQDLGNTSLLDVVLSQGFSPQVICLYEDALKQLARIQFSAVTRGEYRTNWNGESFDSILIHQDLNYFKYYFLKPSGIQVNERLLEVEFMSLAERILSIPACAFIIRDFQGRNIMVKDDRTWFIDFQGGMSGPPHYDLASLLFQAKAAMPAGVRTHLIEVWKQAAIQEGYTPENGWEENFQCLVLLRLLQVLGAYGFRGKIEHKRHFLESIPYALKSLDDLVNSRHFPSGLEGMRSILQELIRTEMPAKALEEPAAPLRISVKSFSYKKGIPADTSGNGGGFVFDCRGLDNPGRIEMYKPLTGQNEAVRRYLESLAGTDHFFHHVSSLVGDTVTHYLGRGFTHLQVAFGCTGGQHRSVYFAERLQGWLLRHFPVEVNLEHTESVNWPGERKVQA